MLLKYSFWLEIPEAMKPRHHNGFGSNLDYYDKLDNSKKGTAGLTLESPAQAELKSTNTTVKGDAMTTIEGGLVKIN